MDMLVVNLRNAVTSFDTLSAKSTLFAERIAGRFLPESRVVVLELSETELKRPVRDVALELAPGTDYFLEVDVAREFLRSWAQSLHPARPSIDQTVRRLIQYAENDT
jgi:hypothetical protein